MESSRLLNRKPLLGGIQIDLQDTSKEILNKGITTPLFKDMQMSPTISNTTIDVKKNKKKDMRL